MKLSTRTWSLVAIAAGIFGALAVPLCIGHVRIFESGSGLATLVCLPAILAAGCLEPLLGVEPPLAVCGAIAYGLPFMVVAVLMHFTPRAQRKDTR